MSEDQLKLDCDALILVTARISNDSLYQGLMARRDEWEENEIEGIYRIGDCYAPRHITNIIFDGHRIGRELDSDHPQYALPFIRERQVGAMKHSPNWVIPAQGLKPVKSPAGCGLYRIPLLKYDFRSRCLGTARNILTT